MEWLAPTLEPGLSGCGFPFTRSKCAPAPFSEMASLLPEPFPHTVRLLPGQLVREEDLVQNAVRCLDEVRSGGMPQQGVCGARASVVDVALEGFIAELAVCARNSSPLIAEWCSMISWEESIPIVSSVSGSLPLWNASCRYPRRLRHRRCWRDGSFYQFGGLAKAEVAAVLIASADAPKHFLDPGIRRDQRSCFASYDACLTTAFSPSDFVMGVMSASLTFPRNRRPRWRSGHGFCMALDLSTCAARSSHAAIRLWWRRSSIRGGQSLTRSTTRAFSSALAADTCRLEM